MPPRPRRTPDRFTGAGDLIVAGLSPDDGGQGQSIQDDRPIGFYGRIVAQVGTGNVYTVKRVDTGNTSSFPAANVDAEPASAYELNRNASVPHDGSVIVWLEPLRGAAGYGFTYTAAAGSLTYGSATAASYSIHADDTWEDAGPVLSLPSSGTYRLHLSASGSVIVSGAPTGGGLAQILGRLLDATAFGGLGFEVPLSEIILASNPATGTAQASAAVIVDYPVSVPTTVKVQAQRTPQGGVISSANANLINAGWLKLS